MCLKKNYHYKKQLHGKPSRNFSTYYYTTVPLLMSKGSILGVNHSTDPYYPRYQNKH